MQANEEWLVLPGIVSAFILNDLLKKEGFSAATKDAVKANGITEESKEIDVLSQVKGEEETMMNVDTASPVVVATEKINGGARCLSKELNASGGCVTVNGGKSGNMVEEDGGHCGGCGGCGGGCGGGGRCGGRCGGMTKMGGCGGGSCTGGSTGCGNCGGGCGNMMKNNGDVNAPSVVVGAAEALNDAVTA